MAGARKSQPNGLQLETSPQPPASPLDITALSEPIAALAAATGELGNTVEAAMQLVAGVGERLARLEKLQEALLAAQMRTVELLQVQHGYLMGGQRLADPWNSSARATALLTPPSDDDNGDKNV